MLAPPLHYGHKIDKKINLTVVLFYGFSICFSKALVLFGFNSDLFLFVKDRYLGILPKAKYIFSWVEPKTS